MNATSNLAALALLLSDGSVWLMGGAAMGIGQFFGGVLGARQVVNRGSAFSRPIYLAAVAVLLVRLLFHS